MKKIFAAMLLLVMMLSLFAGANAYADTEATALFDSGDYEGARRLAHIGKVWSWTAIILSAIGLFLGILILPGIIQLVFYDQQPEPSGGILSHFLELILPGLRELLS